MQGWSRLFCGLDLSLTASGVCVLDEAGQALHFATVGHKLKRGARVKDKVERLVDIASCVMEVVKGAGEPRDPRPLVAIEGYAYGAYGSQPELGELHGVVKSQLWLGLLVEPEIIAPTHARKVVLGHGRLSKAAILEKVAARGVECRNDNEADAYVIAECLRKRHMEEIHDG